MKGSLKHYNIIDGFTGWRYTAIVTNGLIESDRFKSACKKTSIGIALICVAKHFKYSPMQR